MDIVRRLDLPVNFKMRKFKIGQIEWGVMVSNNKHRSELHLVPIARGFARLGGYFRKLKNIALEALMAKANCGNDSDLRNVAKSDQDRMWGKSQRFGDSISEVKNAISILLSKAGNMFPGVENSESETNRKKVWNNLNGI